MQKSTSHVIGLMSGTSLDGVDIVYTSFDKQKPYSFKIINATTISYSKEWRRKLMNAYTDRLIAEELDVSYGQFLASLINNFIAQNAINEVDFIASHGHTIFHKPEEGYTLQIGDGQEIANNTTHKVICDFRTQDVGLGGQGAPLVPIGDRLLFREYEYCLNLGGFANISYEKNDERIAYDICPVNIVLNHYAKKMGIDFDDKGKIASEGKVSKELLDKLNSLTFYAKQPPKSLGLEWVEEHIFPLIDGFKLSTKDVLCTFIEHIAIQISSQFITKKGTVLVTGGGVFNDFLISRIRERTKIEVHIPEEKIIQYKEALIFAFLGLLKSQQRINVLSSVTGAKKDHSSGKIFVPKS